MLPAIADASPRPRDSPLNTSGGLDGSSSGDWRMQLQPRGRDGGSRRSASGFAGGHDFSASRFMGLESRVEVAEKANRALLEETVRLQGDLKAAAHRQANEIGVERRERMSVSAGQLANCA